MMRTRATASEPLPVLLTFEETLVVELADSKEEWDFLIVGSGMGGGTLAYELAKNGKKVLLLEKGKERLRPGPPALESITVEKHVYDLKLSEQERLEVLPTGGRGRDFMLDDSPGKGTSFVPLVGSGTGGSSSLYGMVLERLYPADFLPRQNFPGRDDVDLPESWPVTHEEMIPWYERAESLYRVRGTADPLRLGDRAESYLPPPSFTPANQILVDSLAGQGLHPYHLHLACEHKPECGNCQGFLCPADCKNDASNICVRPAVTQYGAKLVSECTVKRILHDGSKVTGVVADVHNETVSFSAKYVVLASGALATPTLLLQSRSPRFPNGLANDSDLVGRYLMRHLIDLLVLRPQKPIPVEGQTKEVSLNDFYQVDGQKFGNVQSLGPLPPFADFEFKLGKDSFAIKWFGGLLRSIYEKSSAKVISLALIMEDPPVRENRILPAGDSKSDITMSQQLKMSYWTSPRDEKRSDEFRKRVMGVVKNYRPILLKVANDNTAIAHCCGTCRFGDDPKTSVLDRNNRAHSLDNLYVVDASFFPSSGGINPSLTVAANALRIADHLLDRT